MIKGVYRAYFKFKRMIPNTWASVEIELSNLDVCLEYININLYFIHKAKMIIMKIIKCLWN